MTQRDQIEAIDQRLTGLEVRVDMQDGEIQRLSTWLLKGKTALAVIPALCGVLVFLHWFFSEDSVSSKPPPVVDAVCEECLVDPLAGEWYCFDCVVVEDVKAVCPDVSAESARLTSTQRRNRTVYPVRQDGLCPVRFVSRYMQAAH